MGERTEQGADQYLPGAVMTAAEVEAWFVREILPLEAILMRYLRHNWRDKSDVEDLRQEIYVRVCEAAFRQIPDAGKPFLFTTARNLLITRARRGHVIPIEVVGDLETFAADVPGPDRNAMAREELRRLQSAIEHLPARCREAVVLRKIEGLSRREIAQRMGISEATVSEHLAAGMSSLASQLYSEPADLGRKQ